MRIKIDKEDRLISQIARQRTPYCQNCGKKDGVLNAHHIMPRSRSNTRYILDNLIVLCVHCHTFSPQSVHRHPEGSRKWCVRLIGEIGYSVITRKVYLDESREDID